MQLARWRGDCACQQANSAYIDELSWNARAAHSRHVARAPEYSSVRAIARSHGLLLSLPKAAACEKTNQKRPMASPQPLEAASFPPCSNIEQVGGKFSAGAGGIDMTGTAGKLRVNGANSGVEILSAGGLKVAPLGITGGITVTAADGIEVSIECRAASCSPCRGEPVWLEVLPTRRWLSSCLPSASQCLDTRAFCPPIEPNWPLPQLHPPRLAPLHTSAHRRASPPWHSTSPALPAAQLPSCSKSCASLAG